MIHPCFDEGKHHTLDEAKAYAETITGRRLIWRWRDEREVWRAEAGWGRAAEIWNPQPRVGPITVSVGQMA
jgi:hypothetical protein